MLRILTKTAKHAKIFTRLKAAKRPKTEFYHKEQYIYE